MTTATQKKANKKWIETNREHWNELCKVNMKRFYDNNKEKKSRENLGRYYYKKEAELFRSILL